MRAFAIVALVIGVGLSCMGGFVLLVTAALPDPSAFGFALASLGLQIGVASLLAGGILNILTDIRNELRDTERPRRHPGCAAEA